MSREKAAEILTEENKRVSIRPERTPHRLSNNDNWFKEVGQLCDEIITLNADLNGKMKLVQTIKNRLFGDKMSKVKLKAFIDGMIKILDENAEALNRSGSFARKSEIEQNSLKLQRISSSKEKLLFVQQQICAQK